ncbi:hypothetical protein DPMN_027068 [Dreissena polymorpha]|uniref:Uncharacterized protein n=1 Tax=Dreissena polymorpha TaxID=45954 RepID=A0A9D4LTP7_DREPO|nr:hypothetical protein DPMN_027068 [Dreissena polymorpha]
MQCASILAPDQPAQSYSLVGSWAGRNKVSQGFVVSLANSVLRDQKALIRELVWSYAGSI